MAYGEGDYGDCGPYGEDCLSPTPHDFTHCDRCGEGWRVELTHPVTGVVKAVLHPVAADWEEVYSLPGPGVLKASVVGPSMDDIWPKTGLYISRVMSDGTRDGHFGGYVESAKPDPQNWDLFDIGLQSWDAHLYHRLIATPDAGAPYSTPGYVVGPPIVPGPGKLQTEIAVDLVSIAVSGLGKVPLIPLAGASTQMRVRHWDSWEFKNIGEAIDELTKDINGVKYTLTHHFFEAPARWETHITFVDETNTDRGVVLRGNYEAWQYGIDVDGRNQASRVYGVGAGEGAAQMFSVAYDVDAILPEYQATQAWKDVKVPATLDDHTRGAVTLNRDPVTTPSVVLVGLEDVPPDTVRPGDILSADIGSGVMTFRGEKARVSTISWRLTVDEPVTRALTLVPLVRPSLSVKTQTPAKALPPTDPAQAASAPAAKPIAPPTPPNLPSKVLDLSNWKLTLPIGSSGKPTEIKQPQLATYTHPDFFTTVAGPAVRFRAPQKGVTTANSKNTRTELREMKNGGKDNASWSNKSGTHTLEATLAFIHLPSSKPHVVGMQVHDSDDDITVLRLEGSDLWTTNGDSTHGKKIMSGYKLGTYITVKLVCDPSGCKWFLNGSQVASVGTKSSGMYFKAGAYQQAGNSGPDYGEVHIKALKVTH